MQPKLFAELEDEPLTVEVDPLFVDDGRLGRYAEFMVCAELTRLGYRAIHVDAPGFDIILAVNGSSLRVQVKSTASVMEAKPPRASGSGRQPRGVAACRWNCKQHIGGSNGHKKLSRKARPVSTADADLLALFHHRFKTTVFVPIERARWGKVILPIAQVKDHDAKRSLEPILQSFGLDVVAGGG